MIQFLIAFFVWILLLAYTIQLIIVVQHRDDFTKKKDVIWAIIPYWPIVVELYGWWRSLK